MTERSLAESQVEGTWRSGASVLVGITTRNRAEILPRAIRSALAQSYPYVQIAVADDGSEDETPDLRGAFPQTRWERWELNRGLMSARNHLMQTSGADFYLSLDDDAWFIAEDEIATAVEYLEKNPHVAAVAFDILSPDRSHAGKRATPYPVASFIGCGHILRMSAVRDAGFYASSPGAYGSEEKDLCLRLLDRDWEVHFLPGVHIWHDKTVLARDQPAQHRSGVCNDLVFALRRCPFPLIVVVFPVKLLNHVRFAYRHGLLRPCLAGIRLFLRNALRAWQQREPVRGRTYGRFLRLQAAP